MELENALQAKKKLIKGTGMLPFFLMFIVSVVFRTIIANRYPVHLDTYPDELRYYRMATSIANGTGLSLYNAPYDFQKILYVLCITPACLLQSVKLRMTAIFFTNSVMMSAGVFPVYYLTGMLLRSRTFRAGICVLYLAGGHMTYTMTFMSENLWIPLALTLMCLFCSLFKQPDGTPLKKTLWLNFIAGVMTYAGYLCKEIALVFPLGYGAYFITWGLYSSRVDTRKPSPKVILQLTAYAVGFIIPFVVLKLTLFHGMGNSYNQQGLSALMGDDKIYYLLYAMAYYVMNVLTMCFLFPVLLPCMHYGKLNTVAKKMYILGVWIVLLSALVVSYTISVREDYPSVNPRAHMRYIAWVMPVFITIFGHLLESLRDDRKIRSNTVQLAGLCGTGLVYIIFYRGAHMASNVDATMFVYHGRTANQILLINILLAAVSVVIAMMIRHRRRTVIICMVLLFVTQIYDNVYGCRYQYDNYRVDRTLYAEVQGLKDFVQANPESNFLVVDSFLSPEQRTLDTYLTEKNVYVTSCQRLKDIGYDLNGICLGGIEIPVIWHEVGFYEAMDFDYIIIRNPCQLTESANCFILKELSQGQYSIYRLLDSTQAVDIIFPQEGGDAL